jgi:hypothetical protein
MPECRTVFCTGIKKIEWRNGRGKMSSGGLYNVYPVNRIFSPVGKQPGAEEGSPWGPRYSANVADLDPLPGGQCRQSDGDFTKSFGQR